MKAPRLHELTARVVAWHNRHPLARRIDATQVHSIGEVQLPFASAQPWGDAVPAAASAAIEATAPPTGGPKLAEALAQRNARLQAGASTPGSAGLDVQPALPEADAALFDAPAAPATTVDLALDAAPPEPAAERDDAADDDGNGEAALVIPLLDGEQPDDAPPAADGDLADSASASPGAPADADADAQRDPEAVAGDPGHGAALASASEGALPEPTPVLTDAVYPPPHGPVPASALARAVERRAAVRGAAGHPAPDDGPPAPPASRWQRLLAALRRPFTGRQAGLPPLRAAFSDAFIWPLRPAQVARWVQRHGQPGPLAPADWPRRSIDTDPSRRAQLRRKGMVHDLPLHVLTAAIGVGDRRIRVLIGADGSILGPRAYHATRVGTVCTVLAIGLVGLGWQLRPLHGLPGDGQAAELAAVPASAAASEVSAAASAASAPTAAVAAASAPDDTASATQMALAASAAEPAASQAGAQHAGDAVAAEAAAAASQAQPHANIQPALSEEERYAARVEAARMRGEPIPAPPATLLPGPVYAVVSPASRQRATAAGSLAKMKASASRLDGPAPEHGELMESQGQWRAAWWPFTSLVDAERARVLLAGQGIKAEVIEF